MESSIFYEICIYFVGNKKIKECGRKMLCLFLSLVIQFCVSHLYAYTIYVCIYDEELELHARDRIGFKHFPCI